MFHTKRSISITLSKNGGFNLLNFEAPLDYKFLKELM
jgi:hypothetical protein